jgi:1-aminocyclopropane-1-carboxylate deaminase/D-cysteine desulfhydrase-like pyridoxal-dependent ACC family enzyme
MDLAHWLSPVQDRRGRLYKREDLCTLPAGVNGSKLRACDHLVSQAKAAGARRVISASSVLSPQSAMAAVTAERHGLSCTIVLGGTRMASAARHPSVRLAAAHGAQFEFAAVGYNPALQARARLLAAADPAAYHLQYGITTAPGADTYELLAFHRPVADQVANLPASVRTLVLPFGSANTATGVLLGLIRHERADIDIKLIGIGPDRREWMRERLLRMGCVWDDYEHVDLHGSGYATYSDRMPGTVDGIRLHPTYEGKVVRYLNERRPAWWTQRDASTCLWIVGGPLK